MEITCPDLLPPSYHEMVLDTKNILSVLKLIDFILKGIIQSQITFFQKKEYHFFDPHKNEHCCEIRAVNSLLFETHFSKSDLELKYQIEYLNNRKIQVGNKIAYFSTHKPRASLTSSSLIDFLKKNELIFLINPVDKYLFVSYFLTVHQNDDESKILLPYYHAAISQFSRDVIIFISKHIHDRKKSEEALRIAKKQAITANKAKTEFLENMRHDIRTPLTGIIGFARLIQNEATNSRVKDYADHLVSATTALLDFQNEILDAIKIRENANIITEKPFHLKNCIEKVLDLVRPKAIMKNLSLSLLIEDALPEWVRGDSKRLFRIVLELVTNALKFTAEGSIQVFLSLAKQTSDELILKCVISDTGIGIPDDKKEDVFARFHRLSPSSDGVYEGTGLGLTVVKKYIKDLGGKITLTSALEKGTTVTCFIPLCIANNIEAKEMSFQNKQNTQQIIFNGNRRILLVEDHAMTATVTQLMLQELNCQIDIASDAKTALLKSQNTKYDLIFMDLGLPDCDGFKLSKKMRANGLQIPIIALTAHREEEDDFAYSESDINAIFQKPLLRSTIIQLLNTYFSEENVKPVIDLKLGAKRINKSEADAQTMLNLLIKNIADDQKNIQNAFDKKNRGGLQEANHKLLGGLAYCGAPRLEFACHQLKNALKLPDEKNIEYCVRNVLSEIIALKS